MIEYYCEIIKIKFLCENGYVWERKSSVILLNYGVFLTRKRVLVII